MILQGNEYEWTLEKTSYIDYPCALRGGSYICSGLNSQASYRHNSITNYSSVDIGFRPTCYVN